MNSFIKNLYEVVERFGSEDESIDEWKKPDLGYSNVKMNKLTIECNKENYKKLKDFMVSEGFSISDTKVGSLVSSKIYKDNNEDSNSIKRIYHIGFILRKEYAVIKCLYYENNI